MILDHHDQRHAAEDAVRVRLDGEEAMSRGGLRDDRQVLHQAREFQQERRRIAAERGVRHVWYGTLAAGKRLIVKAHAGLADDNARALMESASTCFVRRQLQQIRPDSLRQGRIVLGDAVGGQAVGFGEDHVEADHDSAHRSQPVDQPRHLGTRPRPLPDLFEALLVYVDDDDRLLDRWPRMQPLEDVEPLVADGRDEKRVGDAQGQQRQKQHEPGKARDSDAHRSRRSEETHAQSDPAAPVSSLIGGVVETVNPPFLGGAN